MLKRLHLFVFFILLGFISISQGSKLNPINNPTQTNNSSNVPFTGEPCASSYLEDELLRTDPAYAQLRNAMEQQVQSFIAQQKANPSRSRGVVYTIPVVFHIMHEGEAIGDSTNISYAQALSCINALNRDFRRTSSDGGIAQSGPLGVDAEIEFCIARKDPSGNATNGVTRHDMSWDQGYLDSGVYHNASLWRSDASMKAMIQWNPAEYMNVWVVNKIRSVTNIYAGGGGGVIGYATFPGGPVAKDGIVIRFSATGNDPTGANGYNLWSATDDNRVLTHEVGHYLNLYHTFQSTSSCGTSGASCATIGDRCCDTPPTIVGSGNNCTTPVCPLENKENYMQYQNGACASDFTPDQVARMRAVLGSTTLWYNRNSLVTNNNCIGPPSIELELDTILIPIDTSCSSSINPKIVVCNNSTSDTVTSFDIKYKIDAGVDVNYSWTGSMLVGDCDTIVLPAISTTSGSHSYSVRIDSVNINGSSSDSDPTNNFKTDSFSLRGSNILVNYESVCDSFISPTGKIWKTSGIFDDTLTNVFGCDSILRYSLTIYYSSIKQIQKITASDRGGSDNYGFRVAIDGDYAIVGAYQEDHDVSGSSFMSNAGACYIYEKQSNGKWIQKQKIVASDRNTGDQFGNYVDIDNGIAVVAATGEDEDASGSNTLTLAGSVYIFERNGAGVWNQKQKIVPNDREAQDGFGISLAINDKYIIVGASTEDHDTSGTNYFNASGAAYIFKENSSGVWLQQQKIVASDRASGDQFGYSVAIDGKYSVVGAYFEDEDELGNNNLNNSGSAYVFEQNNLGVWEEKNKLVSSDRGAGDNFGVSIAISGNSILVGATGEDEDEFGGNTQSTSGSVYAFERNYLGKWLQTQKIVASDRSAVDYFSHTISVSGNLAVIGAFYEDSDSAGNNLLGNSGSSYLFQKNASGNWSEKHKFVAADRAIGDQFGYSVSIDGNSVIVGANKDDRDTSGINFISNSGSAYLFQLSISTNKVFDTACNIFTSPSGKVFSSSGIYIDTITSTVGCDSIVEYNLTITSATYDTMYYTICDSFISASGKVWNTTGVYYDTIVNSDGCDSIILYNINATFLSASQMQKLVASDRGGGDQFGFTVSISGDYAIVGSLYDDEDIAGANYLFNSGAAYIYEKNSMGVWVQKQKIIASDRGASDYFGSAVSISGDYAIIGAFSEDHNVTGGSSKSGSGSAYIFERNGSGVWLQKQKIVASDRENGDYFGISVSIDGNTAIIGAREDDYDSLGTNINNSGCAYIFERNGGGVWSETQKIVSSDRRAQDNFGNSVSIYGNSVVIGAYQDVILKSGTNYSEAGSAYVFDKDTSGTWVETTKLVASDLNTEDGFGYSVSINGNNIVVGAPWEDHDTSNSNYFTKSGSAYVFAKDGSGNWNQQQKLVATDRDASDEFGFSVSLSSSKLLVGAFKEDHDTSGGNYLGSAGSAYLFELNSTGNWSQLTKIVTTDRQTTDLFASSVSLDGDEFIIGASGEDHDTSGLNYLGSSGSAYIFGIDFSTSTYDSLTLIECDSFVSYTGKVFTTTGFHYDTVALPSGCDSIIIYDLTILNSFDTTYTIVTCDSYTSSYGTIYTQTGIYVDTISSLSGCDSVITYNITINNSSIGDSLYVDWAKMMGGTDNEQGESIITDLYGNVYTVGTFRATVDFDPGTGVYNLTSAGGEDIFISKLDRIGNLVWVKQIGGADFDRAYSVTVDNSGNSYITGSFNGTVDFDPGVGVNNLVGVLNDAYILKLDSSGNFQWVNHIGAGLGQIGTSITVDNKGDVYSTGYFYGTVDFDPGVGVFNMTPVGSFDIYLTKLSSSGNLIWAKSIGGTSTEQAFSIHENKGYVYLTGNYNGTCDFDPGLSLGNLTSNGLQDAFVAKYDLNGNYIWAKSFGGIDHENGNSVTTDANGNVYSTGYFNSTVDFDPSVGVSNMTSSGGIDIYMSKLDSSGNFVWAKQLGNTSNEYSASIHTDNFNDVYLSGSFSSTMDFDPNAGLSNLSSLGSADMYLAKYNSQGNLKWAFNIGGTDSETISESYLDENNNIFITGYSQGLVDFDPSSDSLNISSIGSKDILVAKYTQDFLTEDSVCDNYTSPSGKIWTVSGIYYDSLTNSEGCDSILKYDLVISPIYDTNIYDTICANQTYTLPGGGIPVVSGVYRDTLNTSIGCDSIIVTNLIIKDTSSTLNTITVCDSILSPSGKIWNSTGIYLDTLTNSVGCDSLFIYNLTVNFSDTSTITINTCDSLISPSGKVWYSTGIYFDTIPTSKGCDSLMTFNLTISTIYRDTLVEVRCDSSITWRGTTYTSNAFVHDTVTTAVCDSIFTLDYTVYPSYSITMYDTACDSLQLPSGFLVTSTGVYRDTLTRSNGCDSIIISDILINNSSTSTQSITLCDSLISPSGKVWKTTGVYFDTISTSSGCDSIMTFNLTISTSTIINNPITVVCDSVLINGTWITSSQNVYDTVPGVTCDTIFIDSITVLNGTWSITTLTICDSMISGSGKVYKNSGFFRDTMPNSQGCDSLVEYYLTVNRSKVSNRLITACGSHTSPTGNVYTSSGSYSDTLTTSLGCDSIINTYLVIDTVQYVSINSTICFGDSLMLLNGTVAKTTGSYNDTVSGTIPSNIIYSEDFQGATYSFTLNTNDTNAITPGASDNAWIINNSYLGGSVFGSPIINTPNQDASVTGNINSTYLHIYNKRSAALSFPSITNSNYIDVNIALLGGQSGLNFSKMTNDISTVGKSHVSFEMYYLCRGSFGRLYYSTNSGVSWTRIGGKINNGGQNWSHFSIVDSAFANQPTLRFAVGFNNTDGVGISPGFAVDEIEISGIGASSNNCDSITTINLTVLPLIDTNLYDTICRGQSIVLSGGTSVSNTGVYRDTLIANIGCDSIVVTNLLVHDTTQSSLTLNECDSVISPSGKIWKSSGAYIDSIPNSVGCDSVIYITVTIDTISINVIDTSLCFNDSLILMSGLVVKTTGVYFDTIPTIKCDSVLQYNLTIKPINDTIINDTICANDTYVLPSGIIVNIAGLYRDTLNSSDNCDSIIITNLFVGDTSSSIHVVSTCDSMVSPSGKVWKTTGVYLDTIINNSGCDSLMSFNLTISTTTYINSSDTVCDSILWRSSMLTTSGFYYDTVTTGICDTIYVLDLLINNSSIINTPVISCDSFTLPSGIIVYTSGLYTDTLVSSNGCDSIINSNVTITTATTSTITLSNCGSYTSPSGKIFTTTGIYNDTITNSGGCDSLMTINLTILTTTSITVLANGCDTFSLPGGSIATSTGVYRDTLINGNGCDSVVITNLILGHSSNITQTFSLCAGETVTVGTNVYGATGLYRDTFLTTLGCDSIINTNLIINPLTPGVITYTNNMCEDATVEQFTATPAGGVWGGPGIDILTGIFDPSIAGAGIHTITYTGPGPCGRTDSATVEVYSVPNITYNLIDDECDLGQGEIDVTIIGGTPAIIYTWSTGETTEDLNNLKKGTYTLNVIDANGCSSTETMTLINVSNPDCNYSIFVPNVFSPDGNGENDVLKVEGNGIETVEFTIFNRWGNLIFKSTSADLGWDGSFKGQPVNQGAFVYFVRGTFVDGSAFEEKGTVTVIRR